MARFPRTEPEILALAEAMEVGLITNPAVYPSPPVIPPNLGALKIAYINANKLLLTTLTINSILQQ